MISGDDIEAFKEWNAENDWWKNDTDSTFEDWFLTLKGMNVDAETIFVMFDCIIGAMRGEYGE
jgi:hypothetical protein